MGFERKARNEGRGRSTAGIASWGVAANWLLCALRLLAFCKLYDRAQRPGVCVSSSENPSSARWHDEQEQKANQNRLQPSDVAGACSVYPLTCAHQAAAAGVALKPRTTQLFGWDVGQAHPKLTAVLLD